jgi:hypothetical protein
MFKLRRFLYTACYFLFISLIGEWVLRGKTLFFQMNTNSFLESLKFNMELAIKVSILVELLVVVLPVIFRKILHNKSYTDLK